MGEFFHGSGESREDQLWSDIGERAKHEKALRYSRMGKGEARGRDNNSFAIEQVEIDHARAVSRSRGGASNGSFDGLKPLEEFLRIFMNDNLQDRV